MAKVISGIPFGRDEVVRWLELERLAVHRHVDTVAHLLQSVRDAVSGDARAADKTVVIVPVADEILIARDHVLFILTLLMRSAIESTPAHGRVAITGQPMDRDVVFAVYDSGPKRASTTQLTLSASEAARAIGGYTWTGDTATGNVVLLSIPLSESSCVS